MEQQFREISRIYSNYRKFEKKENQALKAEINKGVYSPKGIKDLQTATNAKLSKERNNISNRLKVVRDEIIKEATTQHDFINRIDVNFTSIQKIQKYVETCNLSQSEWLQLAENKRDNLTLSRVIHDLGLKHGYEIDNFTSLDEITATIDKLISDVNQSINAPDAFHSVFLNDDDVSSACGKCYAVASNHHVNITVLPVAKDLETAISNEQVKAGKAEPTTDEHKAFLEGFGVIQEEPKAEDILTTEEKTDAKAHAFLNGRKEIDKEDVDYIRSSDYEKIAESRMEKAETN
jgi:hypothetical protein